ncbi:MAG: hypothetical protein ACFFG0_35750 [Candidatus Thorarchaeota archaeon]
MVVVVRNWLVTASRRTSIPDGKTIHKRFLNFKKDIRKACGNSILDSMTFVELVKNMTEWLRLRQIKKYPYFHRVNCSIAV